MKPFLRSVALLAAVGLFGGCKSDPAGVSPSDTPLKIVPNPAVVTVAQGASKIVTIQVVDSNGNALPATVSAAASTADITVTPDTGFQPVFGPDNVAHANTVNDQYRINVTGNNLAATTITVTSGDLTQTIPVIVTPTELAATLSTTTPALGEPITITAPAGLTFSPFSSNVKITKSTTDTTQVGFVQSSNGTTLTFMPILGEADQGFAVRGIIPSYAPSLNLNLDVPTTFTVGDATTTVKLPGTDALATAPELPVLAKDQIFLMYDKPPFGYTGCAASLGDNCNVYKITVATETKFHVTLNWDNTSDLGAYFLDSNGDLNTSVGFADAAGAPTPGPEEGDIDLPPGTWYMAVLRFTYAGSTADPSYYSVQLTGQ
jgi:hypothetical protein